jgi:hypothetical protein
VLAFDVGTLVPWLGLLGGVAALAGYLTSRADARRAHASRVYVLVTEFKIGAGPDCGVTAEGHNERGGPIFEAWLRVVEYGCPMRKWPLADTGRASEWTVGVVCF